MTEPAADCRLNLKYARVLQNTLPVRHLFKSLPNLVRTLSRSLHHTIDGGLAKFGAEGSNPFARSKFSKENQALENGPSGPLLLRAALIRCDLSAIYATGRKSPDAVAR
jgi:hypothetical protein